MSANIVEISSLQNEIIKKVAKLHLKKYRQEEKVVVLEGEKSIQGAIDADVKIKSIFLSDREILKRYENIRDVQIYLVNEKIMEKISSTVSPTKVLALACEMNFEINHILKFKNIVLLDNIKDAGNLGTIIRSAVAFGVEAILLYGDCVDYYCSKVVRSSAGNIFKIPILCVDDGILNEMKKTHKIVSTLVPDNSFGVKTKDITSFDFSQKRIVTLGSEASGLCKNLLNLSDEFVSLDMDNCVESLNLGVFAGILFYIISTKNV